MKAQGQNYTVEGPHFFIAIWKNISLFGSWEEVRFIPRQVGVEVLVWGCCWADDEDVECCWVLFECWYEVFCFGRWCEKGRQAHIILSRYYWSVTLHLFVLPSI